MIAVTLKKVDRFEVESLQEMVTVYMAAVEAEITVQLSLKFYDQILELDILKQLYLIFRKKIESHSYKFNITLRPHQAVLLLYAMTYCQNNNNPFATMTINKYSEVIDNDLKSRVKAKAPEQPKKLQVPHGTARLH